MVEELSNQNEQEREPDGGFYPPKPKPPIHPAVPPHSPGYYPPAYPPMPPHLPGYHSPMPGYHNPHHPHHPWHYPHVKHYGGGYPWGGFVGGYMQPYPTMYPTMGYPFQRIYDYDLDFFDY